MVSPRSASGVTAKALSGGDVGEGAVAVVAIAAPVAVAGAGGEGGVPA